MATRKRSIGRSQNERARSTAQPVADIEYTPYGYVVFAHPVAIAELGPAAAHGIEPLIGETPRIAVGGRGGLTLSNHRSPHAFNTVEDAIRALSSMLGSLGVDPGVFFRFLVIHGNRVEPVEARLVPPGARGAGRVTFLEEHEEFGEEPGETITMTSRASRTENDPALRDRRYRN